MRFSRAKLLPLLAVIPLAAGGHPGPGVHPGGDPPSPTIHEVMMVQEGEVFRFAPAKLSIHAGDRIRFLNVSGGVHNVAFSPDSIPAAAARRLSANMSGQIAPLSGALLLRSGESYTISFARVPPGAYPFHCMPHLAMGMRGRVTVR